MAIEDVQRLYEFLIRFNETGSIQGSHVIRRRVVTVDGQKLKDEIGFAEPVAVENIGSIIGDAQAQALADNASLQAQVSDLNSQVAALEEQVSTLQAQLAAAQG